MSVCHRYVYSPYLYLVLREAEEGIRSAKTRVTDSCELGELGCSELNPGPLEKQQVLLPDEPSSLASELTFENQSITENTPNYFCFIFY